jgi:DnaJ-class molecular chaperone
MLLTIYTSLLQMQFLALMQKCQLLMVRAKIKIPAGTQSGKIFRLRGKGFPEVQGYQYVATNWYM